MDIYVDAEYDPRTNDIRVNDLEHRADAFRKASAGVRVHDNFPPLSGHVPTAVPHETGHAMWHEMDYDNQLAWVDLHDANLRNNKALGDYQYANDPSHSFADAWSVYTTNPERLRNHFPALYDYFKKLSGFEYTRKGAVDQKAAQAALAGTTIK